VNWDVSYNTNPPNEDGVALAHNSLLGFKLGSDVEYTELVLQPELAERWEVSPDAKVFTFHLRQGVRFQDLAPVHGRELTSADVKWTFEYRTRTGDLKDKKLPQGLVDYMYEGMEQVDTPDRYTVVVRFREAFVPFMSYAASRWNPIMAREIYDLDGHFKDRVAGTGRYMLDAPASQKGTRWVWKRNPAYWDAGKPYLDEVRWLVLPQEATAYAAFQTKQVDILRELDYQEFQDQTRANPQAGFYKWLDPGPSFLHFSQAPARRSPMSDVRLRRAAALSIDRDEINKVIMAGQGEWGLPAAFPGLFTPQEARQLQPHDPDEARRLLAQAGYPNGITLEWPVPSDEDRSNVAFMELIQAQTKRAGVNIDLRFMDRQAQRDRRRRGDFDIDIAFGTGNLNTDPDSLQFGRFHCSSPNNYGKICDPELDRLLEGGRREPNPERRRELLRSASKRLAEQAWTVPMLHRPRWVMWQPYLKNYRPHMAARTAYVVAWTDK